MALLLEYGSRSEAAVRSQAFYHRQMVAMQRIAAFGAAKRKCAGTRSRRSRQSTARIFAARKRRISAHCAEKRKIRGDTEATWPPEYSRTLLHSEMTFGCQAAAQGAPASTAKVFLRFNPVTTSLGHGVVFPIWKFIYSVANAHQAAPERCRCEKPRSSGGFRVFCAHF